MLIGNNLNVCVFVSGSVSPTPTTTQPKPQVKPQVKIQVKPQVKPKGKKQQNKQKANQKFRHQTEAQVWVEGQTVDGHMYYYNTITGGKENLKTPLGHDKWTAPSYHNNLILFYTNFKLSLYFNYRISMGKTRGFPGRKFSLCTA